MPISFKVTAEESILIDKIADRYEQEFGALPDTYDRTDLVMDLTACHANGCPLDLEMLLVAPYADFGHDLNGIAAELNRSSGKLMHGFHPRLALSNMMIAGQEMRDQLYAQSRQKRIEAGYICSGVTETCRVGECEECSERDCPHGEPLHYHHDGCPICDKRKGLELLYVSSDKEPLDPHCKITHIDGEPVEQDTI